MRKLISLLTLYLILVSGAEAIELPNYWICEGRSHQKILSSNNQLEEYSGNDPVLLEVFDKKLNQFIAPALFGMFVQCQSQADVLIFQKDNCQPEADHTSYRRGQLDLRSGELLFTEIRYSKGLKIIGDANYQCKFIGHRYNFIPFNHAKTAG
jgi:hypothetical protein